MRCTICLGFIYQIGSAWRHRDDGDYDHNAVVAQSSVNQYVIWSRSEVVRRIRDAAGLARAADYLPGNSLLEVHERTHPTYAVGFVPPMHRHPEDDLVEFWRISDGRRHMPDQFRREGYVADLAFSQVGGHYGQLLLNVITAWLGDEDHQMPVLLHVPGRTLPGR